MIALRTARLQLPTMEDFEEKTFEAAAQALWRYWGYERFRPGQREVLEAVLGGRDALAILPTGGGKSVCYQVPALLNEGLTLVISPLIALMQDQVEGLQARGIPAACINSTLSPREIDQRWTDAEFGRYRLLYVAPERFQTERFQARAGRLGVSLLAVDEAHCISEWGHHFRPAYLEIVDARRKLGDPPTLALTATATPEVRRDIVEHLKLRNPVRVVKGFDRANLVWSVFRTENKWQQALRVIQNVEGSGLFYVATRRAAEQWAERLERTGEAAAFYHGGLQAEAREAAQARWLDGDVRIMVATNAFGMGIDKPDVRFVVHLELPGSLEAYYQEAGRAGRDGKKAYAVLLFQPPDADTQRALIEASHPEASDVQRVYQAVCNLAQVPVGTELEEPLVVDHEAVCRLTGFLRGKVHAAVELLDRQEVWQMLPRRRHYGLIRFSQGAGALRREAEQLSNRALADFVRTLLRSVHADAFSDWWNMDLRILERRTGLERDRLLRGLAFLKERGLLDWRPPSGSVRVQLLAPRSRRMLVDDLAVTRARRRAEKRLKDLLRYAGSMTCRRHFLLSYFGEASAERCGACDVCLGRHREVAITPEDEPLLRHILREVTRGRGRADWFDGAPPVPMHRLEELVGWLVQEGYLEAEALPDGPFTLTEEAHRLMAQWTPRPLDGAAS